MSDITFQTHWQLGDTPGLHTLGANPVFTVTLYHRGCVIDCEERTFAASQFSDVELRRAAAQFEVSMIKHQMLHRHMDIAPADFVDDHRDGCRFFSHDQAPQRPAVTQ